jgi:hypothetical protein
MMAALQECHPMTPDQFAWMSSALQLHGARRLGAASAGRLSLEQLQDVLHGLALRYSAPGMQSGTRPPSAPSGHRASSAAGAKAAAEAEQGSSSNVKLQVEQFESMASSRRESQTLSTPSSRRASRSELPAGLVQIGDGAGDSSPSPPRGDRASGAGASAVSEGTVAAARAQLASPGRGGVAKPAARM